MSFPQGPKQEEPQVLDTLCYLEQPHWHKSLIKYVHCGALTYMLVEQIKNTPGEHQNRAQEPAFALSFKECTTEKFQNANNLSSRTKKTKRKKSNEGQT